MVSLAGFDVLPTSLQRDPEINDMDQSKWI